MNECVGIKKKTHTHTTIFIFRGMLLWQAAEHGKVRDEHGTKEAYLLIEMSQ